MLNKVIFLGVLCLSLLSAKTTRCADDLILRYDTAATDWEKEALPIGNGRIGAMVFGGVGEELITLNEDTLWSGSPYEWDSAAGKEHLPEIRRLVFAEKFAEAAELCRKLQGAYSQSFLPLGNLRLKFKGHENPTDYERSLDISDAVAVVSYKIDGHAHRRRMFVSHPDQVFVIEISTDDPAGVSLEISQDSLLEHKTSHIDNDFVMNGHAPIHVAPSYQRVENPVTQRDSRRGTGMRFQTRLRCRHEGGKLSVDDQKIAIDGAKSITILLACDTSFNGFDKLPDSEGIDETLQPVKDLDAANAQSDEKLLKRHREDYQQLFNRVTIDLGGSGRSDLKMPARLQAAAEGADDLGLAALLFQYGRYLLISSSRPGTQPANLQGIWNDKLRPPWSSNYTVNINTEMNYWLAETANLSELHEPLLTMIGELAQTGRRTAEVTYGMKGWTAAHNVDIWRLSCPVGNYGEGDPVWANWQMAGPWLTQHLWEHYQFTQDETFLREKAYPTMKGAAEFVLDFMVEDSEGRLVTIPSTSPENKFLWQDKPEGISMASTSDMVLIWDLFTNLIEANEILDIDSEFRDTLISKKEKLLPLTISPRGTLQEWYQDFEEADPHHRHVSHLIGLHPGRQISPLTTPDLATAARKTLEARGDEGTGWSLAWKINFWARLHDGDHAHKLIQRLLRPTGIKDTIYEGGGGVYTNLLDAHPPFQIDGNFGATSGICEMLIQSHLKATDGSTLVHVLPALPKAWPSGKASGLRVRGGATVDIAWQDGNLTQLVVKSPAKPLTIKYGRLQKLITGSPGTVSFDGSFGAVGESP
jgi:alpha-L-fucosidase 2